MRGEETRMPNDFVRIQLALDRQLARLRREDDGLMSQCLKLAGEGVHDHFLATHFGESRIGVQTNSHRHHPVTSLERNL